MTTFPRATRSIPNPVIPMLGCFCYYTCVIWINWEKQLMGMIRLMQISLTELLHANLYFLCYFVQAMLAVKLTNYYQFNIFCHLICFNSFALTKGNGPIYSLKDWMGLLQHFGSWSSYSLSIGCLQA